MTALIRNLERASAACGAMGTLVGFAVLVGWTLQIEILQGAVRGWPEMAPITALCFVFTGLALLGRQTLLRSSETPTVPSMLAASEC